MAGAAVPALRRPRIGRGGPAGARAAAGSRRRAGWTATSRPGPPSTSVPRPPSYGATAPWPTCPAPACSAAPPRWATASTRTCGSPRTSTWCGGSARPGGRCATTPPPWSGTATGPALGPWLGRKAFYGTGAADLATRHGDAAAPLVLAPWSAALTVAVLAQRRWSAPAAALVLAATTLWLARRLGSQRPPGARRGRADRGGCGRHRAPDGRGAHPALLAARRRSPRSGHLGPAGRCWSRGWPRDCWTGGAAVPTSTRRATSSRTGSTTSPTAPASGWAPYAVVLLRRCCRTGAGSRSAAGADGAQWTRPPSWSGCRSPEAAPDGSGSDRGRLRVETARIR